VDQTATSNAHRKIKVAILDDHQSTLDGYLYRLNNLSEVEVVATARFASELEPLLANQLVDVLFLDVNVPSAPDNANPYPILHILPKLLQKYPNLTVLVISMLAERALIQAIMDAGASGYILKDDSTAIQSLGSVVISVANGGIFMSKLAHEAMSKRQSKEILTSRQIEVLSLCAAYPELSKAELALKLGVEHSTVRNLLSGAYIRLGVPNLTAAIAKARQLGLITPTSIQTNQ
jgi:DNA-binding NarL/FixJ family response regulator